MYFSSPQRQISALKSKSGEINKKIPTTFFQIKKNPAYFPLDPHLLTVFCILKCLTGQVVMHVIHVPICKCRVGSLIGAAGQNALFA